MYMIHANLFMGIILAHWIADFVLQSNWMAQNKSKNNLALLSHVLTYGAAMGVLLSLFLPEIYLEHGIKAFGFWLTMNMSIHFVTDFITSRITSRLWAKGDVHNFFVVVGFDQVIHYACLFYTTWLLI